MLHSILKENLHFSSPFDAALQRHFELVKYPD